MIIIFKLYYHCYLLFLIEFINVLIIFCRDEPRQVETLIPPEDSSPGDRVYVDGYPLGTLFPGQLNPKKKIWEKLQVNIPFYYYYFKYNLV